MTVGPAKVKACKFILITKDVSDIEIKNTWFMKITALGNPGLTTWDNLSTCRVFIRYSS